MGLSVARTGGNLAGAVVATIATGRAVVGTAKAAGRTASHAVNGVSELATGKSVGGNVKSALGIGPNTGGVLGKLKGEKAASTAAQAAKDGAVALQSAKDDAARNMVALGATRTAMQAAGDARTLPQGSPTSADSLWAASKNNVAVGGEEMVNGGGLRDLVNNGSIPKDDPLGKAITQTDNMRVDPTTSFMDNHGSGQIQTQALNANGEWENADLYTIGQTDQGEMAFTQVGDSSSVQPVYFYRPEDVSGVSSSGEPFSFEQPKESSDDANIWLPNDVANQMQDKDYANTEMERLLRKANKNLNTINEQIEKQAEVPKADKNKS